MTGLLTDNLPLLANASNGIKKLRELILDLAVRGKLVPQNSSDEPANELLKRIAVEKAHLVVAGAIKKQKVMAEITDEEKPFDLPEGWEWVRLSHGCYLEMGQSPSSDHYNQSKNGIPFFQGKADFGSIYPTARYWCTEPTKFAESGDVLLSIRAPVGPTNVAPFRCCIGRGLAALRPLSGVPTEYLLLTVRARQAHLEALATGTTFVAVSKGDLEPFLLPMPPLAEQLRIVSKVDELMALCDRLETQQADAENARVRLVQTLLNSLTQASDTAAIWPRLAEHFHTLFTTESSIDALKKNLLQLAVMGKLVAQSPNDEPSLELLHRAWNCNEKLERALHRENESDDAGSWFGTAAPAGWVICKVSNIAEVKLGSTPSRTEPSYWGGEIPWVSSGEVANSIIKGSREKITISGYKNSSTSMIPPGSVLIAIIGQGKTRGQSAILEIEACTNQNVAALIFDTELIASRYVWLWAQSMYSLHRADGHGGAQPALNAKKVKAFSFPLPPTAEQHRIVAKADQLLALCDQLKSRLSHARKLNEQLACTLVEQAVV